MSGRSHLTPEFDRRLHRLADRLAGALPEGDVTNFRSLVDAGEPGVGLENFCVQIAEHGVLVSGETLGEIRDLAATMGLDSEYWTMLRMLPPLPEAVRGAVEDGRRSMHADPDHELLAAHREAIYRAIGPVDHAPARRVRGRLAVLAARRVAHLWRAEHPGDAVVDDLLALAERALRDEGGAGAAARAAGEAFERVVEMEEARANPTDGSEVGDAPPGTIALLAVGRATAEAAGEMGFLEVSWDASERRPKVDPWVADAAAFAADALSGAVWERRFDRTGHRAFWDWWLDEAVPRAWAQEAG